LQNGTISCVNSGTITGLNFEELDLAATLSSGQVFRWNRDTDDAWRGVIAGRYPVRLAQSEDGGTLYYEGSEAETETAVRRFLRLGEMPLAERAQVWCSADSRFAEAWMAQPGVRVLRQDPHECFFSFLCASVAPIARISGMLRAVCAACAPIEDNALVGAFPPVSRLAEMAEEELRGLGLGFRARRVALAAQRLRTLPPDYLDNLRDASEAEAKAALMTFVGVGEKIADCIALFSLDKDECIPVDTHIWRMARTHYAPELAEKSLTPANYTRAVQAFRDRFSPGAGWAQQILFYRVAVGVKKRTGSVSQ
jgi:N-glycosylase/DNA lyase